MPVFDGNNPDGWVFWAKRYFNMNRLTEAEKLDAAVINLDRDPLAWFQWGDGRRAIRFEDDDPRSVPTNTRRYDI